MDCADPCANPAFGVCSVAGGRPKSSVSHHFSVLRRAGLVWTEVVGTTHMNSLRTEELEHLFPGLLAAVLRAAERAQ
ncbi:ArsR family transcriptional regulator [Acetobacter orientalis]|uniref:ArsR family transcriptional regulator n=1 Tax=Acetobacter orientalis TaxID=146474 RepID=A0A2Z5ZMC0_9PROT|nr:ArsR family transcriptional regulator [Acetobacter orientalis]